MRISPPQFVVVGRDAGYRAPASLALGPFSSRELAEEFKALLDRTSGGINVVLPLHAPVPTVSVAPEPEGGPGTGTPGASPERSRSAGSGHGGHVRDTRSTTVEDAAKFERDHGPVWPSPVRRINGQLCEDPPDPSEL